MNTAATTFAIALATVAAAAAIGVGLANRTADAGRSVVKLERVVVIGKRADAPVVARLPRVVVQARRAASTDVAATAAQAPTGLI